MKTLAERILNRLFQKREIVNCDRDIYLHRWFIFRTKHIALFIHKFVRSDEDRALHCHPWNFLVIPIWRGYLEHSEYEPKKITLGVNAIPITRRVYPILGARFRKGTYKHRVELFTNGRGGVKPSWSLFFRFTKFREWGFYEKTGWVPWNKFWQDKCGDDDKSSVD